MEEKRGGGEERGGETEEEREEWRDVSKCRSLMELKMKWKIKNLAN